MGHEAAGVITELGPGVTGWAVGDRVTFDSTIYCGVCFFCMRGEVNLCDNRRVLGVSTPEYRQNGAFAEYVVVPQRILYRLPDGLAYEKAAMVEALAVAFHAAGLAPIALNDTAVVVGAGMIGLLLLQTLRLTGVGTLVAVDIDDQKLELARCMGADVVLNSTRSDITAELVGLTGGRGADLAYEVVGITPAVQTALAALRKGGALVLVGNLAPSIEFPLQAAVTRQITVYGSCASAGEYPACLESLVRGRVSVDSMISSVAPLSEGASWFERLYRREPGLMKVVLTPGS
jgi:L-iditol 2-dehydrogenase